MSYKLKTFAYWIPTLIWMILIFSFSAHPSLQASQINWQDFFIKKTAHVVEYCILAMLFDYSLRHTTHFSRLKRLIFTLTFIAFYALSDEFHQRFTPGREPRVRDVVIDILGGSIGIYLHRYLTTLTKK
jgi:VanZ family protein